MGAIVWAIGSCRSVMSPTDISGVTLLAPVLVRPPALAVPVAVMPTGRWSMTITRLVMVVLGAIWVPVVWPVMAIVPITVMTIVLITIRAVITRLLCIRLLIVTAIIVRSLVATTVGAAAGTVAARKHARHAVESALLAGLNISCEGPR